MLDHVGLNVSDYEASKSFYLQALAPLGITAVMEFPQRKSIGLGDGQKPYLWIHERGTPSTSTHIALVVPDTETVDAFHAALAAGATTTVRLDYVRTTTRATTERSSSTPTATTSRPSATARRRASWAPQQGTSPTAVQPPSTTSVCPVTIPASGDAR